MIGSGLLAVRITQSIHCCSIYHNTRRCVSRHQDLKDSVVRSVEMWLLVVATTHWLLVDRPVSMPMHVNSIGRKEITIATGESKYSIFGPIDWEIDAPKASASQR